MKTLGLFVKIIRYLYVFLGFELNENMGLEKLIVYV